MRNMYKYIFRKLYNDSEEPKKDSKIGRHTAFCIEKCYDIKLID